MSTDLIVFELQDRRCAVELSAIQEVIPLGPVTPVPTAPGAIVGAVNVHGQVVAVVDLGPLLGLPAGQPRQGDCGLLASVGIATVVLHVSRVCEVIALELEPAQDRVEVSRPIASSLGELCLVHLARAVEQIQRAIRERSTPSRLEPSAAPGAEP